jgi:hypothetical protein
VELMERRAWLVEHVGKGRPHWLWMTSGMWQWTDDANKAMKFADRASAEQAAEECEEDIRILEHLWPDGF